MSCEVERRCPSPHPAAEERKHICDRQGQDVFATLDRVAAILNPSHHESPCNTAYDTAAALWSWVMVGYVSGKAAGPGARSQPPAGNAAKAATPRTAEKPPTNTSSEAKNPPPVAPIEPQKPRNDVDKSSPPPQETRKPVLIAKRWETVTRYKRLPENQRAAFLTRQNITQADIREWEQAFVANGTVKRTGPGKANKHNGRNLGAGEIQPKTPSALTKPRPPSADIPWSERDAAWAKYREDLAAYNAKYTTRFRTKKP